MLSREISQLLKLAGDERDDLYAEVLSVAGERIQMHARRMLSSYPALRQVEQTDDIVQNACIRLHRSLSSVRPDSMARFVGLVSTEVRRTLIDLARHHFGPEGGAANEKSGQQDTSGVTLEHLAVTDWEDGPTSIGAWTRFHEAIGELPPEERGVFELVWFSGMSQGEIAELNQISLRTVKRRWRNAKIQLFELLDGVSPLDQKV